MKKLLRAKKGAAIVEFVIAIVPLLMVFFTIVQFSVLGYVSLLVRHSAFVAARAYAVVNPKNPDSGSATDVQTAAQMAMGGVPGTLSVQSSGAPQFSQAMNTTTVTFAYPCSVPLGNLLVCGGALTHVMTAGAAFPNQGTYMQKVLEIHRIMTRYSVNETRTLRKDDRGAIMVVGLMMITFLIGACWYVFGIGNAITYRENLQNAADATAFAAAVYDARGMNILAMINLVMAAVMAVLVAAKAAQVLLVGINLVTCALSETLVAIPICAATTAAEPEMEEFVDEVVAPPVMITERVLHYTEDALAVVWPWLSEGKSTSASLDYQPGVLFGTTMATSQIPLGLNNAGDYSGMITNALGFNFSGKGSPVSFNIKNSLSSGFTGRFGLPVENDSLNDLCSMAASTVFDVVSLPLSFIPGAGSFMQPILDALNTAIKYLAGNFAFYFCESTPTGLMDAAKSLVGFGGGKGTFNIVNDTVSKRLYSNSSMGDENFAVWANVVGNWTLDSNQLGVGVAGVFSKSPSLVGPPPMDVALGVAKAEFYYEPQIGETIKDPEISMTTLTTVIKAQNCLWNMRWRARLRRYSEMTGGLFSSYSGSKLIQGLFNGVLGQIMKGLPQATNNPALKGVLTGLGQNAGFNPYSNNCNSPSSPNGFANGDPLWYVKEALNPLCAAYALTSMGTNTLLQGNSPGSIGNMSPPTPGIYH